MKELCPSSRFRCVALLPGHRPAFTRWSPAWKGGVADALVDPESPGVWGLVYEMDEGDLKVLDMFEGFQGEGGSNVYERRAVEVLEVGREDRPLKVFTYLVANGEGDLIPPSRE